MQRSTVVLVVVAAIITVVTFPVQQNVFPPVETPPGALFPLFIFLGFWNALAFGVGVALVIYLATHYSKWPQPIRTPLLLVFLIALWFSLLNWVHDGLHQAGAVPPNWLGLAAVEYVFHFPWLIFAGVLVLTVRRLNKAYGAK
ncbi:MAG: hypothetical protein HYY67_04605 [Thaumarchaeota archaeon]|nr:hypothetical protein [Nitrososphaerota archaeon]